MKIGLNIFPVKVDELGPLAQLADRLGYGSLWYGEHVAVPWKFDDSRYAGHKTPFAADTKILDPFAVLTALGVMTKKIRLGTGISILPLRDPFLTARALLAADHFSQGRIDLGVGTGWLEFEFDVLKRDFKARGAILDEFLEILDRLWGEEKPQFAGAHFSFPPIGFEPKPIQKPRIPIHVGGKGPSLRRAAKYDGWYGGVATAEEAAALKAQIMDLRRDAGTIGRPFEFTVLYVWSAPDRAAIEAFAKAGVDQLVVTPWDWSKGSDEAMDAVARYAAAIGLAADQTLA
jgi:probable F420-dependent oxidoreductase